MGTTLFFYLFSSLIFVCGKCDLYIVMGIKLPLPSVSNSYLHIYVFITFSF